MVRKILPFGKVPPVKHHFSFDMVPLPADWGVGAVPPLLNPALKLSQSNTHRSMQVCPRWEKKGGTEVGRRGDEGQGGGQQSREMPVTVGQHCPEVIPAEYVSRRSAKATFCTVAHEQ